MTENKCTFQDIRDYLAYFKQCKLKEFAEQRAEYSLTQAEIACQFGYLSAIDDIIANIK